MSEQSGLTVQQAAGQLGIVERRLRRLLARPEYAARTVTVTRQTKSGIRTATVLPSDLLSDIQAYLQSENNGDTADADTNTAQERQFRQPTRQASSDLAVSEKNTLLVQTINKQDAEILFLRKQVEELTATVRILSERPMLEASSVPPDATESAGNGETISKPSETVGAVQGQAQPWWRRLWRKQ